MAKYDILGDIVSPEALAQLKELEKIANNIGGKLKGITLAGMSDKGEAAFIQKLNAETALLDKQKEKLTRTIEKENVQAQRRIKLTQEEAVTQAALNNVSKLRAVLASQETSALQKLDAQIRLNVLDAQKYVAAGDTQNANYLKLIANTKQLSMEYDRMAKASGSNMVKTQSMYGATFQLTQVMRELPNFAIDARIGFMALSNNLPMLMDSFKNLSKEIDINTGKAYGNMGALKQFGKSLLSMNTIMIVASTLLVLFGDDLVEVFTGKMSVAEKANENFIKSLKQGNSEVNSAVKNYNEMGGILEAATRGFISQSDAIEEYNKRFGETNGYITTFSELQLAYTNETDNYVKAVLMRAYANTFLEESLKNYSEAESLRRDKEVDFWDKAGYVIRNIFDNNRKVYATQYGYEKAILKEREDKAKEQDKLLDENIKNYKEQYTNFAEFAKKNGFDFWGDTKKPTSNNAKTVIREVAAEMKKLSAIDVETLAFKNIQSPTAKMPSIGGDVTQSMNSQLASLNEQYANGILSYKDYLRQRVELTTIAGEANVEIQEGINQEMAENDKNHQQEMLEFTAEMAMLTADLLNEVWAAFFDIYLEKLEEQSEMFKKVEDEKYKDIEDREKAGVLTKQEAEEEKLRTQTYYDSVQEELEEKKKRADKDKFLFEQAMAVANIWINAAVASAGAQNLAVFGAFTPLYAAIAAAQTAIVLAQSIPAFEQGGIVAKDGTILAGEKRHELAILPDGSFFVTANKPTLYDVPKGTEIMPDLNKIDIMDILHLKPLYANHSDNKQTDALLRKIDSSIRNQKQGNFYGMPLIKQLDNRGRFDSRRKSLMN